MAANGCERWSADDYEEKCGGCRLTRDGVRSVVEDNLMLSVVIRVCFVYRFCLIWSLSPSHV